MKTKLTRTFLNTLLEHPPERQVFVWDSELSGFGVRHNPTGRLVFVVNARVARGESRRVTLGPYPQVLPEDARKRAQKILGEMKSGVDPKDQRIERQAVRAVEKARQTTLAQLLEMYMERRQLAEITKTSYRMHITVYLKDWLDLKISEITRKMVQDRYYEIPEMVRADFKSRYSQKGVPAASRTMNILGAMYEWALHEEIVEGVPLVVSNPVTPMAKRRLLARPARRDVIIPIAECPEFIRTVYREARFRVTADYVVTLLLTGMRRSEVAHLKVRDVDLEQRVIRFPKTKARTGVPGGFMQPMSSYMYDILSRRVANQNPDDWVFPSPLYEDHLGSPVKDPRYLMKRVSCALSLEAGREGDPETGKQRRTKDRGKSPFTAHDLRRTFISAAGWLNIEEYNIKALVNHKGVGVTQLHYLQIQQDRLRYYIQRIARVLWEDQEDLRDFRSQDWEIRQKAWENSDWGLLEELEELEGT